MTAPEIRRDASLSEDGVYRWALMRSWDDVPNDEVGVRDVWVMLNPSTADAEVDDPTIRRCMAFSRRWGAGGIRVVNLFALRATDPAELARHPDPVGQINDAVIDATVHGSTGRVIAAWGAHPMATERGRKVPLGPPGRALCLGTTKAGHPRHPLYVPGDTVLTPWTPA